MASLNSILKILVRINLITAIVSASVFVAIEETRSLREGREARIVVAPPRYRSELPAPRRTVENGERKKIESKLKELRGELELTRKEIDKIGNNIVKVPASPASSNPAKLEVAVNRPERHPLPGKPVERSGTEKIEPETLARLERDEKEIKPLEGAIWRETGAVSANITRTSLQSRDFSGAEPTPVIRVLEPEPLRAEENPRERESIRQANDIAFGLLVASEKGHINYGTKTYRRVQTAIRLLRRGEGIETAARRSTTPVQTLQQLIKWGQNRPGALTTRDEIGRADVEIYPPDRDSP